MKCNILGGRIRLFQKQSKKQYPYAPYAVSHNISLLPYLLYGMLCSIMHVVHNTMTAFIATKFDLGRLFNVYNLFRRESAEGWMPGILLPQKHETAERPRSIHGMCQLNFGGTPQFPTNVHKKNIPRIWSLLVSSTLSGCHSSYLLFSLRRCHSNPP